MSWQKQIYLRLRARGWHQIGALFEEIECQIPLHYAMREAMQPRRGLTELPTIHRARWLIFLKCLSSIGVETSGTRRRFKWNDQVQLRYVADRVCDECGGPVIRAGWTSGAVACLACEAPPIMVVENVPLPVQPVQPEAVPAVVVTHVPRPVQIKHRAKMEAKRLRRRPPAKTDHLGVMLRIMRWLRTTAPRVRGPPHQMAALS